MLGGGFQPVSWGPGSRGLGSPGTRPGPAALLDSAAVSPGPAKRGHCVPSISALLKHFGQDGWGDAQKRVRIKP